MEDVVSFYEKPGCVGNAKLKDKLVKAGYKLNVTDMISKSWEKKELLEFFKDTPVSQCLNLRAPLITSGEFIYDGKSDDEILDAMIESPILIKRPLLVFKGEFAVGSESTLVKRLLGEIHVDSCHKDDDCEVV